MLLKSILGKIWALPTTVIGLLVALIGVCIAPRTVRRIAIAHNAICFYESPLLKGPALGLTLGNVILFQEDSDYHGPINVAEHEKQHTLQAEALGIFYIPLHAFFLLKYGRRQENNPLEQGPLSTPPRPW